MEKINSGVFALSSEQEQKKATARAKKERDIAESLGLKALKGSGKQKAWGEKIRKDFIRGIEDEDALLFCASSMAEHAKFWIETRTINRVTLEFAMVEVIMSTRRANEIGAGNDGLEEQLEIRKKALNTMGLQ